MTKICGVIGSRDDFSPADSLRQIYAASWHDNYVRRELWNDNLAGLGHFSIGAVNTEPQPLFSAPSEDAIVYCGKIFDYARLKNTLANAGINFSFENNDAEFMLNLMERFGSEKLPEINGMFSLAVWNSSRKKLTLVNDRYGYRPIYYHHDKENGIMVFSSDLRGVVESGLVKRLINWRACSVFLHFGHHLGEDTSFENVHVLPPASVLTFEHNNVTIKRYWDITEIPINERITYQEALEGCVEHFARAIRRRNLPDEGKTFLFLSGGLDSGRIAAELSRQGRNITTYTSRGFKPHNHDGPVAKEVARVLGLENKFINLPHRHFMTDYFSRVAALVDYETRLHHPALPMIEAVPDNGKINFDGIAGDITFNAVRRASGFSDPECFTMAQSLPIMELAEKVIFERHDFSVLTKSLKNKMFRSDVVDTVVRELHKFSGTPNQLTCWYLMNRTRRAISLYSMKIISTKAESFMPYFDNDLFEFMMSLPPLMRIRNDLRADMVALAYPEYHRVHQARQSIPDQGDDINYHKQKREFLWRNVKKYFLANNWIFNNFQAGPRLLKDIILSSVRQDHVSYLFNMSFVTFFEWLDRYFPHGEGVIKKQS
jgi:asparagine synthase (glutamine-hydrolysing)